MAKEPTTAKTGDYLRLAYGNGTQIAYVEDVGATGLAIYRLRNRGKDWADWTGPRPMSKRDSRIIEILSEAEAAGVTPRPPEGGFRAAR